MKKKTIMYAGIIFLILIIVLIGYLVYINHNNEEKIIEYIPEEEITDEQLRQTIVKLYFMDKMTGRLMIENRKVDAKELIQDPYSTIINMLIKGPENESELAKLIPESTNLNYTQLKGNCLYIDFSEEFIKNQELGKQQEELIIQSIVNTMTELIEINSVIFTIEGQENLGFADEEIKFDKEFIKNIE